MKRVTTTTIGNLFILVSLVSLVLLGFPLVKVYLFPPTITMSDTPADSFKIAIPKIHASAPVIPNVDPWNAAAYSEALHHGVAHSRTSRLPGNGKTVYLFAHSSGLPWEQMYYNTVFLRLGELSRGDMIYLDLKKKRYPYRVTETKEVNPDETAYLTDITQNRLILQTCTPIGTTLKRLLVFADPISSSNDTN